MEFVIELTPPFVKCQVKDCYKEGIKSQNIAEWDHAWEEQEDRTRNYPKVFLCEEHHEEWHRIMYQEP